MLVTGGASGLGESLTRTFAAQGAHSVYFTYCRSTDKAAAIEREFANAKGIRCDFLEPADVSSLADQMQTMELDVLVNNAFSGMVKQHFHKIPVDGFQKSFADNVAPVIQLTQKAISIFRKRKSGRIINVLTSYLANRPPTGLSEYVANKAYLESMSKSWACENASYGIVSNSVSPSLMLTGLTSDVDERMIEEMISAHPLKRLITPAEVADVVLYLSRCTPHINGINLLMNGGADVV